MIINRRGFIGGAAALSGAASVAARPPDAPVPLVLISIDGLRPADVLDVQRGFDAPVLRAMARAGQHAARVIGVTPTSTYPSHTTLLTGKRPAEHGIVANQPFDPYFRNQDGWYWYYTDVRGTSLWSAARAAGRKTLNIEWPVSVGAPIDLNIPQYWRSGQADDRKLLAALATPGLLAEIEKLTGAPYPAGGELEHVAADEARGAIAARLIVRHRPLVSTIYLGSLDHVQHQHGPASAPARACLVRLDTVVGAIARAAREADPRTVVAVVSDHGFAMVTRDVNLFVPFASAGLLRMGPSGGVAAWDAIPWLMGGSAAIVLARPRDESLMARTAAVLREFAADASNGVDSIIARAELDKRGAVPTASFMIVLKPGYKTAWSANALPLGPSDDLGMHGYLPETETMAASFFADGAGVPVSNMGDIAMTEIAPHLAKLIGLTL